MPPDQNHKMEELLKACAKQRMEQAGAPFEIHPATRRLLQAEVRRLLPPPAPEPGAGSSFFGFRRLFVGGAALAAVTACAILAVVQFGLFTPQKPSAPESTALAYNSKAPEQSLLDTAGAPAPGDDLESESKKRQLAKQDKYLESLGLSKDKLAELGDLGREQNLEKFKEITLERKDAKDRVVISDAAIKTDADGSAATGRLTIAGSAVITSPAAARAPKLQPEKQKVAKSNEAYTGSKKSESEGQTVPAEIIGKTVAPAILNTFEIQVNGDQIRLIDADGSVYVGKIKLPVVAQAQSAVNSGKQMFFNTRVVDRKIPVDTPRQPLFTGIVAGVSNTAVPMTPVMRSSPQQQQQQNYSFRASGTNLSLQKVVVVEGVYISDQPPGAQQAQRGTGAAEMATAMKQTAQTARATVGEATDVKIQGQAQLGNEEKIEINAIPVPTKAKN